MFSKNNKNTVIPNVFRVRMRGETGKNRANTCLAGGESAKMRPVRKKVRRFSPFSDR